MKDYDKMSIEDASKELVELNKCFELKEDEYVFKKECSLKFNDIHKKIGKIVNGQKLDPKKDAMLEYYLNQFPSNDTLSADEKQNYLYQYIQHVIEKLKEKEKEKTVHQSSIALKKAPIYLTLAELKQCCGDDIADTLKKQGYDINIVNNVKVNAEVNMDEAELKKMILDKHYIRQEDLTPIQNWINGQDNIPIRLRAVMERLCNSFGFTGEDHIYYCDLVTLSCPSLEKITKFFKDQKVDDSKIDKFAQHANNRADIRDSVPIVIYDANYKDNTYNLKQIDLIINWFKFCFKYMMNFNTTYLDVRNNEEKPVYEYNNTQDVQFLSLRDAKEQHNTAEFAKRLDTLSFITNEDRKRITDCTIEEYDNIVSKIISTFSTYETIIDTLCQMIREAQEKSLKWAKTETEQKAKSSDSKQFIPFDPKTGEIYVQAVILQDFTQCIIDDYFHYDTIDNPINLAFDSAFEKEEEFKKAMQQDEIFEKLRGYMFLTQGEWAAYMTHFKKRYNEVRAEYSNPTEKIREFTAALVRALQKDEKFPPSQMLSGAGCQFAKTQKSIQQFVSAISGDSGYLRTDTTVDLGGDLLNLKLNKSSYSPIYSNNFLIEHAERNKMYIQHGAVGLNIYSPASEVANIMQLEIQNLENPDQLTDKYDNHVTQMGAVLGEKAKEYLGNYNKLPDKTKRLLIDGKQKQLEGKELP